MAKQATQATLPLETAQGPTTKKEYEQELVRHASLAEAKLAVMRDVSYAMKTTPTQGSGINYSYLSEQELVAVLRPAMVHHGITIAPRPNPEQLTSDSWNTKSGGIMHRVRFAITFTLTASLKDGRTESEEIGTIGEAADTGDKAANKAMTAAFKYALRQAFMIESGTDSDRYANQEVTGLASSMGKELDEAFQRFMGAISTAESTDMLTKLRIAYTKRAFADSYNDVLEKEYVKRLTKLTEKPEA